MAVVVRLRFAKGILRAPRSKPAVVIEHTYGPSRSLRALARDASRRAAEATSDEERARALADMRAFDAQADKALRLETHRVELSRGAAALLAHIDAHPMKERR